MNVFIIVSVLLTAFVFRILFDAYVLHKRIGIAFNQKLVSVSAFTNTLALLVTSIAAIPLMEIPWAIFSLQVGFLMAIEAPLYQLFYRTRSWKSLAFNLILARFLLVLITTLVAILLSLIPGLSELV